MGARGPKSGAALEVVQFARPVERVERPPPPTELTDEQAVEWRAVVNRLPADWFQRETHPILADYCRHVVMARKVAQLIEQAESGETLDVDEYDRLGKMAERESRVITSLATKMRITQQSTYDKSKKKPVTATPWDG